MAAKLPNAQRPTCWNPSCSEDVSERYISIMRGGTRSDGSWGPISRRYCRACGEQIRGPVLPANMTAVQQAA